jgi:hypothetical protein
MNVGKSKIPTLQGFVEIPVRIYRRGVRFGVTEQRLAGGDIARLLSLAHVDKL